MACNLRALHLSVGRSITPRCFFQTRMHVWIFWQWRLNFNHSELVISRPLLLAGDSCHGGYLYGGKVEWEIAQIPFSGSPGISSPHLMDLGHSVYEKMALSYLSRRSLFSGGRVLSNLILVCPGSFPLFYDEHPTFQKETRGRRGE